MSHFSELEIIRFIQEFRNPIFDGFFKFLDFFDRQEFFFVLIPAVWLGRGWKWGLRLFYILFLSSLTNHALKELFLSPRPFHIDPNVGIIQVAGNGFPSGAAQTVVLLSGLLLNFWKSSWKWSVVFFYIAFVSFSRVYLGIHFPTDILGGLASGCVLLLLYGKGFPLFEKHWREINVRGEVRNLQYTLCCKDGRRLHVLLNASARFNGACQLINTRGSVVDITERYELARTLSESSKRLGKHRKALQKNNMLLFQWMDQRQEERNQLQRNIQENIEKTVFPLIEKLKRRGSSLDRRHLMLLENHLQDLTNGFALKLMDKKWRLSAREIEICKMLNNGLKTKDIADLLCTSIRTVEHHRNHVRKKLGIVDISVDLNEYLKIFSL